MQRLQGVVRVRIDRIEALLESMLGASWVSRAAPAGWVLSRDAAGIKVEDVYRLFVFRAGQHVPARDADAELESLVHGISARIAETMQMSLEELFRSAQQAQSAPAA
jgi:membrane protein